jgi:hypothetical protein
MVRLHLERLDHPDEPVDPETEEFLMDTNDIYDRWYRKVREEGEAEGEAEALLAVLEARGIPVSDAQAEKLRACRDLEQLKVWVRRAVSAASTEDVLR